MVLLARKLEQQLALVAGQDGNQPVEAWIGHSLLPFQLLGLARHLAKVPAAQVLISLMFEPGETLEGAKGLEPIQASEQATANTRIALAALARACQLQGHRLTLAFPSRQQEELYTPLLAATGLASSGVHPAVVGGGCRVDTEALAEDQPLVLLHWGDLKDGKGRREALTVLEQLLERGAPRGLEGWGWLFQSHSHNGLPMEERALLKRASEAGLGLQWLEGPRTNHEMVNKLASCSLALLAYDPQLYGTRSSGMLWQWGAAMLSKGQPAAAVGHPTGWLAKEAPLLGIRWSHPRSSDGWLEALTLAVTTLKTPAPAPAYGQQVLGQSFATWCTGQLKLQCSQYKREDEAT
jgi:hypothetical protein